MSHITDLVKQRREALGLSQTDVANAVGVTPQAVSNWERRDSEYIRPKHLLALARVLEVSVEDLVRGNSESPVPLSADEKSLLATYRKLTSDEKRFMQKLLRGLAKSK